LRIAFASGKGGTGKTTLATNIAVLAASTHHDVFYADCDVEEPNGHIFLSPTIKQEIPVRLPVPSIDLKKCTMCGVCSEVCQFNAIAVIEPEPQIFPSLCHGCGACVELCPEKAITEVGREIGVIFSGNCDGPGFLGGRMKVGESLAPPVTRALKERLPEEGMIIIDAPPGTSCPVIEAVEGCDLVILVTEPTPFGLNDLKLAHEMVRSLGIPYGVVINRSDMGDDAVRNFCIENGIEILQEIPFDRKTAEVYSRGELSVKADLVYASRIRQLLGKIERMAQHA